MYPKNTHTRTHAHARTCARAHTHIHTHIYIYTPPHTHTHARQCINLKIVLITYKSINDMAPEYLSELVSIRKSYRKLRSSSQILLRVPVSRLKSYGDCAFSVAAPTLWNRLPADIRNASSLENFKSVLKTHLFKVAITDK